VDASTPRLLPDVAGRFSFAKVQGHCYISIACTEGDFIHGDESRISQVGP
jgi:hypothetical protein